MAARRPKGGVSANWDDLKVFLAVARAGSLVGAAKAVGQTQPTMGRRLYALEEAVGHKLLSRTAEGFSLTQAGTAVLAHAERMEEEALAFERRLAGQGDELGGMLRVSSSDWFATHVLAPILARFSQRHPRAVVELVTETRLVSLSRRETDLSFRFLRFQEPDVMQKRLMHIAYEAYASRAYLERQGAPDPATGGEGHSLITMDTAFSELADVGWLTRLLPEARFAGRSNNRDVQARMCAEGAGIAVLPVQVGAVTPGLERVWLGESPPGRDVWSGYHRDLHRLPLLRALLDATTAELAPGHREDGAQGR
ncbi:LysR family transcriptional regulator [Melittangium boletus]|uniref:LysR family transcriptional regulator n=1 Tax=Melittangium boletus DSM 14713 TaxID=1294270 RepID=A0A250ILF8_9BACT|nr:LysR family transcriptional regulator [Melittangium boletus]ATB31786.1 LysR family transcriptional regulator [Melittangium boletus DSM 14713]